MADRAKEELLIRFQYLPEIGRFIRVKNPDKYAESLSFHGYYTLSLFKKNYLAHRVAWLHVYKEWPQQSIDHIDRDKLNNRISNLRDVSTSTNIFNSKLRRDNKTGYKGVTFQKSRGVWIAQVERVFLGRFKSAEEAHAACQQFRATHLIGT